MALDCIFIFYDVSQLMWRRLKSSLIDGKEALSCMFSTIVADVLAMQGARTSAVIVFTYFCWNNQVSAVEELNDRLHLTHT